MQFISRYKTVIIIAVIIIVAFIGYSYFFTGNTNAPALASEDVTNQNAAVDADLISLLLTLKGINLDDSIFGDPAFQSLTDFGKDLIPEPVGRSNPFAPIGAVQATNGPTGPSQTSHK